jgi:hypothetical protein
MLLDVFHLRFPKNWDIVQKEFYLECMSESVFNIRITPSVFHSILSFHHKHNVNSQDLLANSTDLFFMHTQDLKTPIITAVLLLDEHNETIIGRFLASQSNCKEHLVHWFNDYILPLRTHISKIVCVASIQDVNFYSSIGFKINYSKSGAWVVMTKCVNGYSETEWVGEVPIPLKVISFFSKLIF